jgi:ABC-type amino acid transport substrate-binding protein
MSEQPQPKVDLAQELRELGEQLKKAIRVARDHPQTKEFERQISQGVADLGAQIDRAIQNAKEDEHLKKASEQVQQAAQSVKESGAPDDLARGLAKGVHALNEQIRRAIEDAEKAARENK